VGRSLRDGAFQPSYIGSAVVRMSFSNPIQTKRPPGTKTRQQRKSQRCLLQRRRGLPAPPVRPPRTRAASSWEWRRSYVRRQYVRRRTYIYLPTPTPANPQPLPIQIPQWVKVKIPLPAPPPTATARISLTFSVSLPPTTERKEEYRVVPGDGKV